MPRLRIQKFSVVFLSLALLIASCGPSPQGSKNVQYQPILPFGSPDITASGTISSGFPTPVMSSAPGPQSSSAPGTIISHPQLNPWPQANMPQITSIDPSTARPGTIVTIYGDYFNDTRDNGSVVFIKNNDSYVGTINDWTNKQIRVKIPDTLPSETYQVAVSANNKYSNYQYITVSTTAVTPTPTATPTPTGWTPTPTSSVWTPTPTPTATGSSVSYSISGKVYNGITSQIVSGASIQLTSGATGSGSSDSSGNYTVSYTSASGTAIKIKATASGYSATEMSLVSGSISNQPIALLPSPLPTTSPTPPILVGLANVPLAEINLPWVLPTIGIGTNKPNTFAQAMTASQVQTLYNWPYSTKGVSFGFFASKTDSDETFTPGGTFIILPVAREYLDVSGYATTDLNLDNALTGEQGIGTLAKLKAGDIIPVFKYNIIWQASVPGIVVKANSGATADTLDRMLADALAIGGIPAVNGRFAILAPLPSYGFYGACIPQNTGGAAANTIIQF